jgi:membrane protein YqaA with SNARE-associated domain
MEYISIGFTGLFIVTFLSATILPFSSELFLLLMLSKGYDPVFCLLIATIGNSLGGITNYGLGRLGDLKWLKKVGVTEQKLNQSTAKIQRYGSWMALLCWLPFVGDLIGLGLGFFRAPWLPTFILITIGKLVRYAIVTLLFFL